MDSTNQFSLTRLGNLMKMELRKNIKGLAIAVFVILEVHFTGFIIDNIFNNYRVYNIHDAGYAFCLLLGGFIISSMAFGDMGNTLKRNSYLTLPASNLEKFLSAWLLSSVGWILVFTPLFVLHTLIVNSVGNMLFRDVTFYMFSPFSETSLEAIRYYIVLQGIFLVGAVNFRGYVFLKTLFAIFIIGLVGGIMFYTALSDLAKSNLECSMERCNPMQVEGYRQLWEFICWIFWWLLAPVCWVLTYIGLKDQEV